MNPQRLASRRQRGASLLLVLLVLAAMLLGTLAFSRMSATGLVLSGNTSQKEGALRASEVGFNAAFAQITATGFNPTATNVISYSPVRLVTDAQGLPTAINWSTAVTATVNEFSVSYFIDRQCDSATPTNPRAECLVRDIDEITSARVDADPLPPRYGMTYRVTVRVVEPRGTTSFIQGLMTLGL
ncbi:hypothetical protein [Caldimonas sp. KR1-144]|uniref:hypothetical protein n=1 Tax=Caldimonas sp. KR1-144 TaxID=3400911 RepID=UPI003BFC12C7